MARRKRSGAEGRAVSAREKRTCGRSGARTGPGRASGLDRYPSGSVDPTPRTRMDLLPPRALLAAAAAVRHGLKYERRPGEENWRGVPAPVHLAHALAHVRLFQAGDRSEEHVSHALARFLMWGELELAEVGA